MKLTKEQLLDAVYQLSYYVNEHGGSGGGSGTLKPWVYDVSGEEQIIGVYGGKPLYRKAFTINVTCASNSFVDYNVYNYIANCDRIINATCYDESRGLIMPYNSANWPTGGRTCMYFSKTGIISYTCGSAASVTNIPHLFILEYTKTTDAEGSGNNFSPYAPSNMSYSYEEKVVGTWVDGKPLYQKTLYGSIATYQDTSRPTNVRIPFPHTVVYICGGLTNGATNVEAFVPIGYTGGGSNFIDVYHAATTLMLQTNMYNGYPYYILTVKYTKTTD